ncbi:cysteine dioxygenase [Massilia arenosa]|uniref:Cysteine dioxygenase n=1 Tax=Zemynaea arenosa TaxID=2561931 RepID=A0A4Y9S7N1_9BURK|nr:cysteine dioxygenase [Massilia arenosa]TFW17461.1 cysteine dioxygenase [Massilia arenosa]
MTQLARLRGFIQSVTRLLDDGADEARIFRDGRPLLADLVRHDDWLPDAYAQPHPDHYQQYLLHCDPLERFSVVSFVWGPGQTTPVHDHTVWGMVGILRGAELCEEFDAHGQPAGRHELRPGQVDLVSPNVGDVHRVSNLLADAVSVSIHVYGANIGRVERHVFQPDGTRRPFVSGYANELLPNLWV